MHFTTVLGQKQDEHSILCENGAFIRCCNELPGKVGEIFFFEVYQKGSLWSCNDAQRAPDDNAERFLRTIKNL